MFGAPVALKGGHVAWAVPGSQQETRGFWWAPPPLDTFSPPCFIQPKPGAMWGESSFQPYTSPKDGGATRLTCRSAQ